MRATAVLATPVAIEGRRRPPGEPSVALRPMAAPDGIEDIYERMAETGDVPTA